MILRVEIDTALNDAATSGCDSVAILANRTLRNALGAFS
jgi:hypothetical protein